jgi:hypothetical protein
MGDAHMEEVDETECRKLLAERHLGASPFPTSAGR